MSPIDSGDRQNMVIEWEDSSPGIDATSLEKLFEPFFRMEASRSRDYGGAGLGLSIVRNIVEAHSGTIKASASSYGGLNITMTLPLARKS